MLVRNKQYEFSDVLGRWTDASDEECPCRSCYHPHDFGYRTTLGVYKTRMLCLSRERGGCPDVKPEPEHVYTKYGKVCKRCGYRKKMSNTTQKRSKSMGWVVNAFRYEVGFKLSCLRGRFPNATFYVSKPRAFEGSYPQDILEILKLVGVYATIDDFQKFLDEDKPKRVEYKGEMHWAIPKEIFTKHKK